VNRQRAKALRVTAEAFGTGASHELTKAQSRQNQLPVNEAEDDTRKEGQDAEITSAKARSFHSGSNDVMVGLYHRWKSDLAKIKGRKKAKWVEPGLSGVVKESMVS
jgi:hypothetical protein